MDAPALTSLLKSRLEAAYEIGLESQKAKSNSQQLLESEEFTPMEMIGNSYILKPGDNLFVRTSSLNHFRSLPFMEIDCNPSFIPLCHFLNPFRAFFPD